MHSNTVEFPEFLRKPNFIGFLIFSVIFESVILCFVFNYTASKASIPKLQSSSHMHVINHNWLATKQRLYPQSVADISRHSVLSGDRIRQCETSSGSRHKDTDQCLYVAISFCRHRSVPAVPLSYYSKRLPTQNKPMSVTGRRLG